MPGEEDLVPACPLGLVKRAEKCRTLIIEIAGKPAPAVVAAEVFSRFEQGDPHLRMRAMHGQRSQSAREAAPDDCHIQHAPAHRE